MKCDRYKAPTTIGSMQPRIVKDGVEVIVRPTNCDGRSLRARGALAPRRNFAWAESRRQDSSSQVVTSDGWDIYGGLALPAGAPIDRVRTLLSSRMDAVNIVQLFRVLR